MNKMVQNILRSSTKLAMGALVLAASFASVSAQNPTVLNAPLWKKDAKASGATGSGSWFANDNNTRGFAYNAATGNLLVVSRTGGLKVVRLSAETGDSVGVLNVTGIAGGVFAGTLIDVTPAGRIFMVNLTVNPAGNPTATPAVAPSPLKIYTWENESSAPVVAYSGDLNGTTLRYGDSFRLDWTDGASNVYVGGAGNPNLAKFTWANNALTLTSVFNFGAPNNLVMRAVRGMAPIVGQDSLWINEFDYTVKKISTRSGAIGTVIPARLPAGTFDPLKGSLWFDYADFNGKKLFATFPGNLTAAGQSASLVDASNKAELAYTAAGPNANANASGGPIFDVANKRMYLLATNNHIASYDISAFGGLSQFDRLTEYFNYATGSTLVSNGWIAHSGAGTNPLTVVNQQLKFSGYAGSGQGKAVAVMATGQDAHKVLPTYVTTGTVYAAFLVKVTSASLTGDYFFHLGPDEIGTSFYNRVFVKKDAINRLAFGIQKTSGTGTTQSYTDHIYVMGRTYLIVVGYEFGSGVGDDVAVLSVNPTGSSTPSQWSIINTVGTDIANIGSVAIRQGTASNTVNVTIGGLRVGTDYGQVVGNPIPTSIDDKDDQYSAFALEQNYPNPFNPSTSIQYSLPETANVTLHVYSITGQLVATLVNEVKPAGVYNVSFDASTLASGVYIYRINAGGFTDTQKMTLIK